MRPRIYPLLDDAVDIGVRRGWRLAHKHCENPTETVIQEQIHDAVMSEILERFMIDDDSLG